MAEQGDGGEEGKHTVFRKSGSLNPLVSLETITG